MPILRCLAALVLFLGCSPVVQAQTEREDAASGAGPLRPVTVVVLGSSNAAGVGPDTAAHAWPNRLRAALSARAPGSRVLNFAKGGYTTFHLLPTGTATPEGRATPDPGRNVTQALAARADAIVISLTSNDSAREVPVAEQLANYDRILAAAGDTPVWITTPTPRTEAISPAGRAIQEELRDATLARFGDRALDFWHLVATPDGSAQDAFSAGDGIHFNGRAHARFADAVLASSFSDWVDAFAEADQEARPVWDEEGGWHAGWTAAADLTPTDSQNVWTAHRATFDLAAAPASARTRIAVDSKYWLWVNGAPVVREGGLKRGPMRGATYADTLDLAPHLRAGTNTLAVLAWHFGAEGFSHASSGAPGLLVDLRVDGEPVALDWRARKHPAYGDTGPPHPNYRLPESNVRYDARAEMSGWIDPPYDDADWPAARLLGPAGSEPWGPLVLRPIPQWRDFGLQPYGDAPPFPYTSDGDTLVVSLPYNAQITPWLEVEAEAGRRIEIRTDAYVDGGGRTVRAEYVTRVGRQRWEAPGWMHGHRVRYAIPAGVTVHGLRFRESGYETAFAGSFSSSDPALDALWQKALRTLYITMRDTYMDTPGRERAQWWGDVVLEMGESFYALDRRADALARKGILELAAWQRPDSTLYAPVPAGPIWSAELPTQMLASVGQYGFWTYYLHTGDLDTIRRVYPAVRDYLALWEQDGQGLVVPRSGGWTWGDWGANKDMPLLFNGWYALALQGQRHMALALGRPDEVPAIDAKLRLLSTAFDEVFWTGEDYRSPEHEGATDDRGHALGMLAGLIPPERYPAVRVVLLRERHASPYFEKYVAEALMRMGHVDDALARLKARYAEMIESPLTTLWEGWELNSATYGGGTYNHAWSGGPLTLLSSIVAGVEPIEPGYATFRVVPRLGPLQHVDATVPSVRGDIVVAARQEAGRFVLDLVVPDGTRALVEVPYRTGQSVRFGEADTPPAGIERAAGTGRYWAGKGTWRFVVE